ncbi:hypothetical protein D3C77_449730 [compost metagenome]
MTKSNKIMIETLKYVCLGIYTLLQRMIIGNFKMILLASGEMYLHWLIVSYRLIF